MTGNQKMRSQTKHHHIKRYIPQEFSKEAMWEYISTRISSLKPPLSRPPNPLKQLREMTTLNWLMWFSGYVCTTWGIQLT